MVQHFLKFAKEKNVAPIRDALVNQLISGSTGEEKSEYIRGQIRGLDRAIAAFTEASSKFVEGVDD